jgi:spermidine/putrescine-binding protein
MTRGGIVLFAALALVVTACSQAERHDVSSDELDLYTWTEYIPDSVIEGFEDQYGVDVKVTYYASNEEAIRGLQDHPGTYDLVVPSDYAVIAMIDRGMLEPIDTTADLENFGNIESDFRSPYFDPGSSLREIRGASPEPKYTVPYQWGTTGIVYDTTQLDFVPATWADLARPELAGRIALVDDARDVLGAALIATGHDRDDASASSLADAQAWVRSLDALPVNADNPEQPLVDGDAIAGIMYNGNAAEAMRTNPDLAYVLPEGGSIWFDNLAIPDDAPHRDAALAFIDHVLEPDVGAEITKFFGYSSPNAAALEELESEGDPSVTNTATNPPRDAILGLIPAGDIGTAGSAAFERAWEEVRP